MTLARRLAWLGYSALRLDLSGIGDSPLLGPRPFREQAVIDTRAAMDRLGELLGLRQFVLFGLCSGADNSLATALADERVVGIAVIDPYAYATPRSRLRKLSAKVQALGTPRNVAEWAVGLAVRRVRARLAALRPSDVAAALPQSGREPPPVAELGARLEKLLARRVRILLCYSGALEDAYNHEDQIFEVLPGLRGRVDRAWFPRANHQFTEIAARRELYTVQRIADGAGSS